MDFEIRKIRSSQGPKKPTAERGEYFRLMDQGFSSYEACRVVGINRRTGKRWRNGWAPNKSNKKGAPPVKRPVVPPSGASGYLREDELIPILTPVTYGVDVDQVATQPEQLRHRQDVATVRGRGDLGKRGTLQRRDPTRDAEQWLIR
ncbi:hypothetical protein Sme01_23820 [Sphaerisporangium melleum]|uniref:Uncharacterized protein n=1 Tax=Sphaerisporangium melleum TaxID=321316 RepID=A0A917QS74_9ACTN|nr:helix-turn-helix domain-containing protein [Sphaerisporangium melleum]GGK65863.1 hypothetical protein GCM10007964_06120 [Sphaerisporangium melleum]GII69906.1 hypothetical protein Sme01_23820 [Sphaerisporangium melleum]